MAVAKKTGFAGPLIRPTGTFAWVEPPVSTRPSDPRWGEEGVERSRHVPSPRKRGARDGSRPVARPKRQVLTRRLNRPAHLPHNSDIRLVRAFRLEAKSDRARIGAFDR
ncbi:hypothetical protein E0H57_04115 [Rhizobium leguminosarum bv. viciae]|nr:hypothetical protein E0H57_04115 [Rhizobium leguminosarum bv. viciae]